jgi:hypothetical protein
MRWVSGSRPARTVAARCTSVYVHQPERCLAPHLGKGFVMARVGRLFVECIIFMDGDSADEVLNMIHPELKDGNWIVSWERRSNVVKALEYLKQWDYGEPTEVEQWQYTGDITGEYRTRDYLMTWSTQLNWVCLYRRVTVKQVREWKPELLAV